MGYACPVCDAPQMDAGHLANHLAFTALLGDDDHGSWLDEHAPDWADAGEAALAERVVEHADEREFPQVFEDTTGRSEHDDDPDERSGVLFDERDHEHDTARGHGHDHAGSHDHADAHDRNSGHADALDHERGHDHGAGHVDRPLDDETARILEEARELTERRRETDDEE